MNYSITSTYKCRSRHDWEMKRMGECSGHGLRRRLLPLPTLPASAVQRSSARIKGELNTGLV